MNYADFAFYKEQYKGMLSADIFERLIFKSSAEIAKLTFGRVENKALFARFEREIRCATCAVLEAFYKNEAGGGIASETNDGISINYVAGVSKAKTDDGRIYEAALRYLAETPLLERGV